MGNWRGRQLHVGPANKLERGQLWELKDCIYIPELTHNLFSLTKAMSEGGLIVNDGDILVLKVKDKETRFDFKIKTKHGYVMATIVKDLGINVDNQLKRKYQ